MRTILALLASSCLAFGQLTLDGPAAAAFSTHAAAAAPAITFNSLTSRNNGADATSYATTASYTPTANALVLATVVSSKVSAPDIPTFSGNSLTWIRAGTTTFSTTGSPGVRLTLFYAQGASPANGTGTADFAGATQTGCSIAICEFPNANTTTPLLQTNINAFDQGATLLTNNLAALAVSAKNAVYCAMGGNKFPFAGTNKVTWTEDFDSGYTPPNTGVYGMHILATTDNLCITTNSGAINWASIAVEINSQ